MDTRFSEHSIHHYHLPVLASVVQKSLYCMWPLYIYDDDDQWRYSPDRTLASLSGFMIVYSTMWGYQLHDRPVLDTLIQQSEPSSSNYQRLSWRSWETQVRNGSWILPTSTYRARTRCIYSTQMLFIVALNIMCGFSALILCYLPHNIHL
jgi:hypothetical protein